SGYDAIFLGIGAWKDYSLRVEGEDLKGCYTGIDFLTKFARHQQGDGDTSPPVGNKCVVIGGGNTAIDCVRTLIRLGAKEVTIVYRRTRKEMPANMVEIEAAEHEGVKFHFLAAPTKAMGDENGNVVGLEYLKMELGEPDDSGRRRPVPIEGSETVLEIDMLVTAIGQGPDISFKENEKDSGMDELATTRWDTIDAVNPETLQTNIPFIFTGGDSATGASLVVEGIGGGRRAARSIHQFLNEEPVEPVPQSIFKKHIPGTIFDSVDGIIQKKRAVMPELPVAERIKTFEEADLVLEEKDALEESKRCLNCCRVCYNRDAA
ncbi:MAG: FAD-dependent oxidoreductase, partial [Desulfobacterales bacterium]|nr:FAD-dependent oxidoreductase [Desulfobacterales bacterium]